MRYVSITAVSITALTIFLYSLASRLGWGVFDTGCPTYALNMIHQIVDYGYPASFPGVPNVPANYHQGTFWISAKLVNLLSLDPYESLRWLILITAGITVMTIIWFSSKLVKTEIALILVLTGYFSTSPPNGLYLPFELIKESLGWYSYISLFEYNVSTSWPIALFLILCIVLIYFKNQKTLFYPFIILLILPFFNATAFTIVFITYCYVSLSWIYIESKNQWNRISIIKLLSNKIIVLFCYATVALVLPKYNISAFTISEDYEVVRLLPRFLEPRAWVTIIKYIALQPLINWFSIIPAYYLIKSRKTCEKFVSFGFFLSLIFPLLIWIKSVDQWDNIHKFVVLTSFFSIFTWIFYLSNTSLNKKRIFYLACTVSIIGSIPGLYNMGKSRMSFENLLPNFTQKTSPDNNLIKYLKDNNKKIIIISYGEKNLCGRLSDTVLSYGSFAAAGYYFENFLLSKQIEDNIKKDYEWDLENLEKIIKKYDKNQAIIVTPNNLKINLESILKNNNLIVLDKISFEYYTALKLKKID